MINPRRIILIFSLFAIVAAIFYLESLKNDISSFSVGISPLPIAKTVDPMPMPETADSEEVRIAGKSLMYPRGFEISTPDGFINSDEFSLGDLLGKKVILLDFWTYSCINCQRTIPYLNSWHEKYGDKGLVIVGLHTPEFEFEKNYENVLAAVKKFGIKYPVVLDNDFSTWSSYRNQYWPRKYLIDIDGFVVYDHIGEGGYEETEKSIQRALAERAEVLGIDGGIAGSLSVVPISKEIFQNLPNSPEVYFGAFRNTLFGNGRQQEIGSQKLSIPAVLESNTLYLSGDWSIEREYAQNISAGARILFKYRAQDVYMVASGENPVKIKVLRDGEMIGDAAGEDVDAEGNGSISADRLYKLIQDSDGQSEHTIEIQIEDSGLKAFTFTFG